MEIVIQSNGGIMTNINVHAKNVMYLKKIVWKPAQCNCESGKYLASIMDDSVIMCNYLYFY